MKKFVKNKVKKATNKFSCLKSSISRRTRMIKIGFLIAGSKGFSLFKEIHRNCSIAFVSSYKVKGTLDDSFNRIKSLCSEEGYHFIERQQLNSKIFRNADFIFTVGWQYMFDNTDDRFVIFHDSLLPKLRGFCPTITALIEGEKKIGVTAIKADKHIDCGSIYSQASIKIKYPIKIKDAFILLSKCYVKVAMSIIKKSKIKKALTSRRQNELAATYSIWRDELDYYIDWNWDAEKIKRFIDAVGWPFQGARAFYKNKEIFIDDADVIEDLKIENRNPGKIWSLDENGPNLVCGKGMIKITSSRYKDGAKVKFTRLRERLGYEKVRRL
jgi:methionyl-tRNA formyltransferase